MTIMAQPTQDMDISSSLTPNDNSLNNDSSKKFSAKEIAMGERNEINLERMHGGFINVSKSYENQEFMDSQFIDVQSSEDTFPWLIKFNKMICSSVGSKSSQLLERLLVLYTQNILTSINTYCEKALDMMKLKNHINNTLMVFHLYWQDIKEYVNNYDSYLNEMSVLLGIYIDMELKTFKHSTDSSSIATKLLSALWIYLDNSEKHIFRVLLKLKLITKKYMKICDPIFRRSFISLKRDVESLTDVDYVRYLLALKMWKRMKENLEGRKKVNKMAIMILGPCAPKMRDELLKIIPQAPLNETLWLLLPNAFDLKTACNNFLAFEESMSVQFKDSYSTMVSDLTHFQKPQIISSCGVNHIQECTMNYKLNKHETCNSQDTHSSDNIIDSSKFANKSFSAKKRSNFKKHKRPSKLKPGEILFVDLTEDNGSLRVNTNMNRKARCKRKLEWLKMMKKKCKVQKQASEVKCRNQVEIADAHSTENSENSVDKILVEYLPISDNKVSESTESCASVEEDPLGNNTHYVHSQNMHDYICNKRSKQLKGAFQHKQRDNTERVNAAGSSSPKNNSNICLAVNDKPNKNGMEIDDELLDCTETARKPIGAEVNTNKINIKVSNTALSSTMTMKSHLAEILPPTKQDFTLDGRRFDNDTVPRTKSDKKEIDRCNKQIVIKQLIETDISSEPEARKRAESLKKVCDLGAECPNVNSTAICTQYDSKDNAFNSNRSNLNVIKNKISEWVTSSIIIMKHERNGHGVSNYEALNNTRSNESPCTPDYSRETADSAAVRGKLDLTHNDDKSGTNLNETAEHAGISPSKGLSRYGEKLQVLQVPQAALKNSVTRDKIQPRKEGESSKCTNTMVDDRRNKEVCAQTELEICNDDEANKGIKDDKLRIANIRDSIFGSCSMDKKDISNTVNVTCPRENIENNENSRIDTNVKKPVEDVASGNNYDGPVDKTNVPLVSHLCPGVTSTRESRDDLYKSADKEARSSVAGSKYIAQDSVLQDNIDGLPHLKPESEVKCDQIKVKDYASLRYACCIQTTDDKTDTNDSSNTISQLLENPSTDIINRIVGIYPEDALDKAALHVEVTSNDAESGSTDNELCKVVPYPEASVNYDADALAHNLAPIESNMQTVKENTNVILNGETVVLLQKSPNSNLYIINKAVENSTDHSNDDEISRLKEKNWVSSAEVCGQFEAVASLDHASYNLELTAYSTELPYQESKCAVGRGKGIKVEPEESNISEAKPYSKKVAHSADMLSVNSQMYQDVNVTSKPMNKRKPSKPSLSFRQNIKQEFNNIFNHIAASNCAIPGCNGIHSRPHKVDGQHPLHIPASHPITSTSIYGNCAGNGDLCVPYHKHCTSVSCSLQINATTPLHSRAKSGSPCGRSHCSCLNCTYDIVTHCKQCIHPTTDDTHVSCIESSPYFLSTHSSVQSPAVQEHDRAKSEAVMGKLYDDQLLCKIEKSLLQGSPIEKLEAHRDTEKLYKEDADNKLPLKKRLKAHAMAYGELPIKAEKVNNYPPVPMMSIVALEALDGQQKRSGQIGRAEYELSPENKEEHTRNVYHSDSNLVPRDYYKDVHVSGSHQSIAKESTRKLECQFRSANDQSSNTVCQESCLQRAFKINAASLKRFGAETMGQEGTFKKVKKTQLPLRQTRSLKRNVPKVNYSYTDVNFQKPQIISSCGVNHIQECTMNYKLNKHETCNSQDTHSSDNTIDSSKFANKICSPKERSNFKKHKRTSKLKPGEILFVDLTEDNGSLRVNRKKSRKARCKRKLEWLKMMKKKCKVQKQAGEVKCRNQVEIADAHSTENSENSVDKILAEYLPISDNKVSESTESCASVEEDPLGNNTHYVHSQNMHDYICNKRSKQLKGAFQHKQRDNRASPLKQNDVQHSRVLSLLDLLNVAEQNVKEPKAALNVLRESSEQNVISSQHTVSCRNTADKASEVDTQDKEELFPQPKSSIETILVSKECQNIIVNTQSIRQELPTSIATEADTCRRNASVYEQSDYHLHGFRSIDSHSSQATEAARQKASYDAHECTGCCKETEVKPFFCHNYSIFNTKNEDATQNAIDDNSSDKKPICDKSVIYMLSDLDKCMDVLNRIGEHIMTVHAEKQRLECSDKTNMCTVSTTVLGDQIAKSSLWWAQNIHSLTNSEKLSKILELYGKKEFTSSCNSKGHHRCGNKEANAMLNLVKCDSENLKKLMVSASQTNELHSHGNDHAIFTENKLPDGFICSRIKSEFEQSIKEGDCENFEVVSDQSKSRNKHKASITNDQPRAIDSLAYHLNNEELYEDAHSESALQSLSRKSDFTKTGTLDKFENIDILDSILNGNITMEDEQEIFADSQSSLMSPIDYDNSNNVLNCISEFFLQSEHSYTNEKEERYITSDIENSSTPLLEGSLGTTGILNFLLDFELTNMDSPPNDFIYSNVQAVNPRLIKKSFEGEVFSVKNESESNSQGKVDEADKNDAEEMLSLKRDEFCNNRSDSVDSDIDLVGFGLNTSREGTHEFPTLIRNLSSVSSQSTALPNSDDISSGTKRPFLKYSLSSPVDKLSTDTVIERSYIFRNEDTINQVQSFSHAINCVSPSICTSNSLLSNELMMNYTSSRRDDSPSSHKHAHMKLVTSTSAMEQPSDCNLLSSTDLVSCKTVAASRSELPECKNSPKQKNVQENIQSSCKEKQNYIRKPRIEVSAQSKASKQKLRCKKKIKQAKEEEGELHSSIVQPTQDELSLRCSPLTVINPLDHQDAQSTCEMPLSFHVSNRQKSRRAVCASKNMYKQLKCIGIHQLRNMSQRKPQILLNFHGNSTTNTIITEDSKVGNSQCTTEDNISEDSNALRESVQPQTPEKKSFYKLSKRNVKVDADIVEANLTTDKRVIEISNNIMKSGTTRMLQNVDAQPSKFVKKQVVTTVEEKMPLKKKKLSPKFCEGLICTNGRKNMVGK